MCRIRLFFFVSKMLSIQDTHNEIDYIQCDLIDFNILNHVIHNICKINYKSNTDILTFDKDIIYFLKGYDNGKLANICSEVFYAYVGFIKVMFTYMYKKIMSLSKIHDLSRISVPYYITYNNFISNDYIPDITNFAPNLKIIYVNNHKEIAYANSITMKDDCILNANIFNMLYRYIISTKYKSDYKIVINTKSSMCIKFIRDYIDLHNSKYKNSIIHVKNTDIDLHYLNLITTSYTPTRALKYIDVTYNTEDYDGVYNYNDSKRKKLKYVNKNRINIMKSIILNNIFNLNQTICISKDVYVFKSQILRKYFIISKNESCINDIINTCYDLGIDEYKHYVLITFGKYGFKEVNGYEQVGLNYLLKKYRTKL